MNRLLGGKNVVSILGGDRFSSSRLQDRIVNERMDLLGEQNPFVTRQISQR